MKRKIGQVIFRKIGGKIIPIKVAQTKDLVGNSNLSRKIQASTKDSFVGKLEFTLSKRQNNLTVASTLVEKPFRRKGVAKAMMKKLFKYGEKTGKRFVRSDNLQSPSMARLRARLGGSYKAGKKRKLRTKFFADQFGPYGEETRRVSLRQAIEIIKENKSPRSKGRLVTATTMLKRKKK